MTSHTQNRRHSLKITAIAGLTLLGPLSVMATATEFCVSCTQPPAMYRCAVNNNGELTAPPGAQLTCIKELARQGGHKTCAVRRDTSDQCAGKLLVVSPGPADQLPPDHPFNKPPQAPAQGQGQETQEAQTGATPPDQQAENTEAPAKPTPDREPRTVVELADQTVKSSKKNLDNAGKAVVDAAKSTGGHIKNAGDYVGGAAKNTWTCITSWFSKCGNE